MTHQKALTWMPILIQKAIKNMNEHNSPVWGGRSPQQQQLSFQQSLARVVLNFARGINAWYFRRLLHQPLLAAFPFLSA
jgi:hypothetical protein